MTDQPNPKTIAWYKDRVSSLEDTLAYVEELLRDEEEIVDALTSRSRCLRRLYEDILGKPVDLPPLSSRRKALRTKEI